MPDLSVCCDDQREPLQAVAATGPERGQPERRGELEFLVGEERERKPRLRGERCQFLRALCAHAENLYAEGNELVEPVAKGRRFKRAARRSRNLPPASGIRIAARVRTWVAID